MLILGVECWAMHSDCAPPASQKLRSTFYIYIKETGFVLQSWSRRQEYQFLVGKTVWDCSHPGGNICGWSFLHTLVLSEGQWAVNAHTLTRRRLCQSHESEALGPWHDCAQSTLTQYFIQHGICSLHFHSGILCPCPKQNKTKQSMIKCSS